MKSLSLLGIVWVLCMHGWMKAKVFARGVVVRSGVRYSARMGMRRGLSTLHSSCEVLTESPSKWVGDSECCGLAKRELLLVRSELGLLVTAMAFLSFSSSPSWNLYEQDWYRLSFSNAFSLVTKISSGEPGGDVAMTACMDGRLNSLGKNISISFSFSDRLGNADPQTNLPQYACSEVGSKLIHYNAALSSKDLV